jgi:colanic acid/amylovoran biosynthesis glycosyltransferase
MGKPVISTYVAGIPELVADGETGWLIPAGDESRLAAAIEACLQTDIATLRTMGAAARKRVIAAHDVDKEAGKLAELFRSSIAARDSAVSARQHPHDLRESGGTREASGQISVKGDGTS